MIHEEFLAVAASEAQRGCDLSDGLPFGAVIAKNDRLLVTAHNESSKRNDQTAHSELLAVRKARRVLGPSLRGCILYSTCKPCQMCLQACWISELDAIIYEDERVSPNMDNVKKFKKLILKNSENGEEMEKQATWKKSILRQVDDDEKNMLLIASRPMKRNLSGRSTGSSKR